MKRSQTLAAVLVPDEDGQPAHPRPRRLGLVTDHPQVANQASICGSPAEAAGFGILDQATVLQHMADAATRLARRNEALEDFAALVAHELKSPLEAALLAEEPRRWVESALDVVDLLLQAMTESSDTACASLRDCIAQMAPCVCPLQLRVSVEDGHFPLGPGSLSVILRNLLANAAAASASHVNVFIARQDEQWHLVVDDDGVGLDADRGYQRGNGIGLALCRRIAERNCGRLEVQARRGGGVRAILTLERTS